MSDATGYILSTPNGQAAGNNPYAAYNFCRKVNQSTDFKELNCDDTATNAFATIVGVPTSGCSAASTDSYTSIASQSYAYGDDKTTLGLQYSNPDSTEKCSLLVGLMCNEDMDGYTTTDL